MKHADPRAAIRADIRRLREAEREISEGIVANLRQGLPVEDLRTARREIREALEDAHMMLADLDENAK